MPSPRAKTSIEAQLTTGEKKADARIASSRSMDGTKERPCLKFLEAAHQIQSVWDEGHFHLSRPSEAFA